MPTTTQQQTSLEAYKLMQSKIPNDHEAILAVLEINSDLTYCEIAKLLRWLNPNKVSRRMPELIRLEKVESSGTKICPIAKSRCTTYKLKL
jgi:hypothetical protein